MNKLLAIIRRNAARLAALAALAGLSATNAHAQSTIGVTKTVSGNVLVGSLSLSSGARLTVPSGATLSLGGSIVGAGTLSLSGDVVGGSLTSLDGIINTPGDGYLAVATPGGSWAMFGSGAVITANAVNGVNFNISSSGTLNLNAATLSLSGNLYTVGGAGTITFSGGLINATSLTNSIPIGNLAAGVGATSSTFWRGDGTWAAPTSNSGTLTGLTISASTGLTAGVTSSTSTPQITLTLSSNLTGWNAVSSGSFVVSNAINLGITGSASPAANSASLSLPSGMVLSLSGSSPVTLSMGTGLNTFAGGLSSSGAMRVTNATASTGTTSGAAIISGGLGVQGALYGTTATFSGNLVVQGTTFTLGNGLVTYDAGNGRFQFSSFGGHAILTDYGGNLGLGIGSPVFVTNANGSTNATATYSSTTYGPSILWTADLFSYGIAAGGSTQAVGGDGVARTNRFFFNNGNTTSMTIESLSGAITAWRGLAVTGSNSFLTVSVASTFTGTLSGASASFTTATFAAGLTGSFSSFAALNINASYTLTSASPRRVLFTGVGAATTHTISVDATTQQIGAEWRLVNTGTASVTLKSNGGGLLGTAYTNSITLATLNSVATTSGSYTVQRIPLLDSSGRLAPGNSTFLGPKYLDLNNGYIASGFTVSGSVQLGANDLTTSGTIQGATLTSSGDVNATSGTIRTSGFEATGNAQFSGSSVSISSATITFSGIPNTGATDFVGMINPGVQSQIVSLTVVDAASLLGIPSSRTVKEDITPMSGPDAVELLGKINVVHYRYTAASGQDSTKPHIGFIAEDVANVFPEGGNTVGPKSKLVPSVSDRDLLALLFAVVQEQQREIEKLKAAK